MTVPAPDSGSWDDSRPIVLGAYAARSCPVKTQNHFDPTQTLPLSPVLSSPVLSSTVLSSTVLSSTVPVPDSTVPSTAGDDAVTEVFEGADIFASEMLDLLTASFGGRVADLRATEDRPMAQQADACAAAVEDRADLIIGGLLPRDLTGHRSGRPSFLLRGADRDDGHPGYRPVLIKMHKLHERKAATARPRPNTSVLVSRFSAPDLADAEPVAGHGFRIGSREPDLIELSHYHRMLVAAGWDCPDQPYAGIIGTDEGIDDAAITWMDLDEPLIRSYSRSDPQGWTLRTPLQRYDHEHSFRVDVARSAIQQDSDSPPPPVVHPIVSKECGRCPWWDRCRSRLAADDVSLRIGVGSLDSVEISTLRSGGISTITDLADADLDAVLGWYLPRVTHRTGSETRLRQTARRATMIASGIELERTTSGPIDVPSATLEVDFDIETTADGLIYLWGFRLHHGASTDGTYHRVVRFTDPDANDERDLAITALTWLQSTIATEPDTVVYHYSGFEVAALQRLAKTHPEESIFCWAQEIAHDHFCDLLPLVKQNFFGAHGLGLKPVATGGAGFSWRDDDAGGLNSTRWFWEAVHAENLEQRALARTRILEYNEDDVIATAMVRAWLRAQ